MDPIRLVRAAYVGIGPGDALNECLAVAICASPDGSRSWSVVAGIRLAIFFIVLEDIANTVASSQGRVGSTVSFMQGDGKRAANNTGTVSRKRL